MSEQRRPDWKQLEHLVVEARRRGWSEDDVAYLASCIGITWAKACFATEAAIIDGTHPVLCRR